MTTKAEKPTLQGQRIKARKRDEKAKYDPIGFRDAILAVRILIHYCIKFLNDDYFFRVLVKLVQI